METLNYKVLEGTGYNGYILKDAPVKVMQFGEGNFLRAFVDYFYDIANEKAGYVGFRERSDRVLRRFGGCPVTAVCGYLGLGCDGASC